MGMCLDRPWLSAIATAWGLIKRTVIAYTRRMIIRSVRHRGLRRLIEDDNSQFLEQGLVDRVRKVLTVLILSENLDSFIAHAAPGWRVHRLSGDRRDEWSVSVSGNWRITFEEQDDFLDHLNLEDYH